MHDPVELLNAWLALEALEPVSIKRQQDLLGEDAPRKGEADRHPSRLLVPFDLDKGLMPWQTPAGDRQVLGLDPETGIRWYVPLGFVRLKPAVEQLVTRMEPDGPEREAADGLAIVALTAFDEQGYAAPSKLLLSAFGWAVGEVLAGRINTLHRFLDIQDDLRHEIAEPLVERHDDGRVVATGKRGFVQSMKALMRRMNLDKDLLAGPEVAIRVLGDAEKDPVDIINSFLLDDLRRVRTALTTGPSGDCGPALRAYLGITPPGTRYDVLQDKVRLEALLAPARIPAARWPAPPPTKLVTLQQAAVNLAVAELADGGIMAINGPPGTGKTTLLRDVVAAVIAERADRLAEFDDPTTAFTTIDLVAEGGQARNLYALDERLRGRGIVVASANNAAVRNVSAELPLAKAVDPALDLRHFAGTADHMAEAPGSSWGLVAAVLGNRANRSRFVETVWWDEEWGLERYFAAITNRVSKTRTGRPPSRLVESERPPANPGVALERWRRARLDYLEKRAHLERLRQEREDVRAALSPGAASQQALETAERAGAEAMIAETEAAATVAAASIALKKAHQALADARRLLDGSLALKPGLLGRLLGDRPTWQQDHERALARLESCLPDHDRAEAELTAAQGRLAAARASAKAAAATVEAAKNHLRHMAAIAAKASDIAGDTATGPAFWDRPHADIHTASPWSDPAFMAARDAMFVAALALHRAFIDAAANPMKSNLGLMMEHLKGKRVPSGAAQHLEHLWDSFFLLVPLVSSTFASIGRLLDGMGRESIGWLIVDEAGQATPQQAAGAIWRARRALIIGDPLQIEPVTTVPVGLIRSIADAHGARPDLWTAPRASVQTLADAASTHMTVMSGSKGKREIGLPLLVHRRCMDPMFTIANTIAYDGLMVQAVKPQPSAIAQALSPWLPVDSCWIDVQSSASKFSPQEAALVLDMLRRMAAAGIREPSLYIISPFRTIAHTLRQRVVKSGVLGDLGIPWGENAVRWKKWAEQHVGTVHTFQGKEAEAVILVLGASAAESRGSRNWAGNTPNILNVAATRAKQVIYVVGHREHWRQAGSFAIAAAELKPAVWPLPGQDIEGAGDEAGGEA